MAGPEGSASRAGDRNGLRAVLMLARWNRALRLQSLYFGGCVCCTGGLEGLHFERQAVAYLREKCVERPGLLRSLADAESHPSAEMEAAPVARLMRLIATERDPQAAREHALLLDEFETLVQSLEAVQG